MLPWKQRKRYILPVNQNLSSVYFSLAKFQLVSCNVSLAKIWQMTYSQTANLKLCSATLTMLCLIGLNYISRCAPDVKVLSKWAKKNDIHYILTFSHFFSLFDTFFA